MEDFAVQYIPLIGSAVGWVAAAIIIFRMLSKGTLHTDREFQNEKAAAKQLQEFYAVERTEDKATIAALTAALQTLVKSSEKRAVVDEVTIKTMQAVQQQAFLRDIGAKEERQSNE